MPPMGIDRTGAGPLADDSRTGHADRGGGRRRDLVKRLLRAGAGVALVVPLALIYQPNDVVAAPTTLVVNSTLDASDINPGDGLCATGAATCTLRAAIQ